MSASYAMIGSTLRSFLSAKSDDPVRSKSAAKANSLVGL